MPAARPIPEGVHTVTPYLVVRDAAKAVDFYKRAFGARELSRFAMPDGQIMHSELQIGDSLIYLSDEFAGAGCRSPQSLGGTCVNFHVYVENVDAAWQKAVEAGARVTMPLADQFWGDRYGKVQDPFGHEWALATHKEDVAPEEMSRRAKEAMAKYAAEQRNRTATA